MTEYLLDLRKDEILPLVVKPQDSMLIENTEGKIQKNHIILLICGTKKKAT